MAHDQKHNWVSINDMPKPYWVPDHIPMYKKWKRGRPTKQAKEDRRLYNEWYQEWKAKPENQTVLERFLSSTIGGNTAGKIVYSQRGGSK